MKLFLNTVHQIGLFGVGKTTALGDIFLMMMWSRVSNVQLGVLPNDLKRNRKTIPRVKFLSTFFFFFLSFFFFVVCT